MQKDVQHTIGRVNFTDSAGKPSEIVLLDAIRPLLASIPRHSKLLLHSRPITTAWPLSVNAEPSEDKNQGKKTGKRVRGDDCETLLCDLMESLSKDIPQAIAHLQRETIPSWLTHPHTDIDQCAVFSTPDQLQETSWPMLLEIYEGFKAGISANTGPLEITSTDKAVQSEEIIHRLIIHGDNLPKQVRCNISSTSILVELHLPQRSAFLLTNLLRTQLEPPRGWSQLINFAGEHPPTLILLDPPYPNLSAKRLQIQGSKYKSVEDLYDLWKMVKPVKQLLQTSAEKQDDVLVGCWVTNHAKAQRFVLTKLFPAWDLVHIGQVVWVKVTSGAIDSGGELVFPLDNKQGRKPFEVLLLGRRGWGRKHSSANKSAAPTTTLFASVPLDHSRKPDVLSLLSQHFDPSQEHNVYEFFARSLHTGRASGGKAGYWVSIGNEPFKYNQESVGYLTTDERSRSLSSSA